VAVRVDAFARALRAHRKLALDSAVLIYHLEGVEPYADLTEAAFTAIAEDIVTAVLSTVAVTQLLVKPFSTRSDTIVQACERFILTLPNTSFVPVSFPIAREAARLRAAHGLRTPDAISLATALAEGAKAFLTNDKRLGKVRSEGVAVLVLDDYV
jgi:predicted nucleic acid-binding protein